MEERWKSVKGYEGLYEVSDWGRVKSLNYMRTGKEGLMHPSPNMDGYLCVPLSKNGKTRRFRVNRLVAEVFVHNPHPRLYKEVNHKDENRQNNCASNLEWCDRIYNANYSLGIAVEQLDMEGNVVRRWTSANEAERNGYDHGAICRCCNGIKKTHKGFRWRYAKQ